MKTHPQTMRALFLKLKFEYQEEFEECWATFRSEFSKGSIPETNAAAEASQKPAEKTEKPEDFRGSKRKNTEDETPEKTEKAKPKAKANTTQ